ncbi:MAG TPA: DUF881 domain-containing protein [Candidatus Fusicatenibacter intestinipullorum]|nr:DUF881 domain-containing protein [Candidatus Fusicatenibacter intestinipullorum]
MVMIVAAILGFMLATQIKTTERQKTINVQRAEELTERLRIVEQQRDDLAKEIERLQANSSDDALETEVERLKEFAGEVPLEGKGIQLILDDSKVTAQVGENPNLYIIHDDDLLRVINELRAAGAEAISINGERLVSTSEIRCAGPTLSVNNNRSAPPYVILAIGNPSNLASALKLRGGVLDTFKFWGIQAELTMPEVVKIPAFKGRRTFEYAQAAEEDQETAKEGK